MIIEWAYAALTLSANLKLTTGKKFTLIGTPQGQEIKDPSRKLTPVPYLACLLSFHLPPISELEFLPDGINGLDIDFSANPAAAQTYINDQRNQRKIRECTQALEVNIIHPLREGKRLLVLDLDYSAPLP